jgi:hypothetical protein
MAERGHGRDVSRMTVEVVVDGPKRRLSRRVRLAVMRAVGVVAVLVGMLATIPAAVIAFVKFIEVAPPGLSNDPLRSLPSWIRAHLLAVWLVCLCWRSSAGDSACACPDVDATSGYSCDASNGPPRTRWCRTRRPGSAVRECALTGIYHERIKLTVPFDLDIDLTEIGRL